jgi:hypothetical protein
MSVADNPVRCAARTMASGSDSVPRSSASQSPWPMMSACTVACTVGSGKTLAMSAAWSYLTTTPARSNTRFKTTSPESISAVGTPMTRRPPHSPGRAVFPHPVPRLDSLPRKACSQANNLRRLPSVMRGRSMGTASRIWVKRTQLKLRRFPPRRLSHLNAHFMAQSKKRKRALEFHGPHSSDNVPAAER